MLQNLRNKWPPHPVEEGGKSLEMSLESYRDATCQTAQMPDVLVVGTLGAYDEERKWKEEIYVYPLSAAKRQKRPPG